MQNLNFRLSFNAKDGRWRVTGADDDYWDAPTIDDLPQAVRGIVGKEADDLKRLAEPVKGAA